MANDLVAYQGLIKEAETAAALRQYSRPGPVALVKAFVQNRKIHAEAEKLTKHIGAEMLRIAEEAAQAREHGAYVIDSMAMVESYRNNASGIRNRTSTTFSELRDICRVCPPLASITSTKITKLGAFAQKATTKRGRAESPGFRVEMENPEEEATDEDNATIREIERFILHCGFHTKQGYVRPPKSERPRGWKPGFRAFVEQFMRDSIELDWAAVEMWESAAQGKDGAAVWPVVTFCAVDAAKIRPYDREYIGMLNGVPQFKPIKLARPNVDPEDIEWVKVDSGGSRIEAGYTPKELIIGIRNPRTDERANGFGLPENEMCLNTITGFVFGLNYNINRFQDDNLPRGMLAVAGNLSQAQLDAFKLNWAAQIGSANRWKIPILSMPAGQGAGAQWFPWDQTPRDMEYHQFLFTLAIWMHSIHHIHPEETGYDTTSPFHPPLSEASPEAKLEHSQSIWMEPALNFLAATINEIIWRNPQWRRYCFKFVGIGQYDELQDVQMRTARMEAGLSTPEDEWNELDLNIKNTGPFADHDAWKMPGLWAANYQLIEGMKQQKQQMEQQQAVMMAQGGAGAPGQAGPPGAPGGPQGAGMPPGGASGPPGQSPGLHGPPVEKALNLAGLEEALPGWENVLLDFGL